jgi:predicted RNase H-like HicB family nuclease
MVYEVNMKYASGGSFVAECPALPGCIAQGRTESEALANMREAITAWFWDESRHVRMTLPIAV